MKKKYKDGTERTAAYRERLASVYELAGRLSLCPNLLIVAPPRLNPKKPHSVKVLSFFLPPETRLARCLVLPRFV